MAITRGKTLFVYTDQELANRSGYDLIHPDDLNYFSCAHQELIKTGSSGLISYRWQTKLHQWIWMQSSCKVIYKNSKPDFIICTHRQLTEDEGQDLFGKRGNEFKLPYPLLDIDVCAGFGFGDDEISSKPKPSKSKKKAASNNGTSASTNSNASTGQMNDISVANNAALYAGAVGIGGTPGSGKDCHSIPQSGGGGGNGKKRKSSALTSLPASAAAATAATATCIIGGLPPYCTYPTGFVPYDGSGGAMIGATGDHLKTSESLYPYNPTSFGFDAADMYRAQGAYGALHAATSMYHHQQPHHQTAGTEPYRLDMVDKHQGYFLDAHSRQYQHPHHHLSPTAPPLPYGNTVSSYNGGVTCGGGDFAPSAASKYAYDVSGVPCAYGFDSYGLDFSKRMDGGNFSQISQIHPDMKRSYAFDYTAPSDPPHASSYPSHSSLMDSHNIHDRYATANRLAIPSLDPMDLRNTTGLFGTNSFMNTVDTSGATSAVTSSTCFSSLNSNPTPSSSSNHLVTSPSSISMFKPIAVAASSSSVPITATTPTSTQQSNSDAKNLSSLEPSSNLPPLVLPMTSYDVHSAPFSLPHNSVIKCTRQRKSQTPAPSSNTTCDISTSHSRPSPGKSPWRYANTTESNHTVPGVTQTSGVDVGKSGEHQFSGPGETNVSCNLSNTMGCHDKDISVTGIPISVVKQPSWTQSSSSTTTTTNINNISNNCELTYNSSHHNGSNGRDQLRISCDGADNANDGNNNNRSVNSNTNSNTDLHNTDLHGNNTAHFNSSMYNDTITNGIVYPSVNCPGTVQLPEKDWITAQTDLYSKTPRVLFPDPCQPVKHLGLKIYDRGDNPLLSFSEMTHSLMSSTY
ncbi:Aryl hydrocarbon receptor [Plakobranchus ocellatus]|uniref:Aryl hydrocarbon receptor n=1 Tax=Plakobranchus ocellatus TaxID=259542 RepID=A0AAV4B2J3_9GAST|nr:Aryl hydrocarbon receptor [Plakobranchus ocellatus]